ncbi:hypothetical protein V5P93_007111 [Actinokineospora auranticolor]|uniref:Uncharacterized protein n=1 Tax=Actinokineospora auranticolor TaxID=155976 RepID=A0A2S6GGW7_9PSEU|nr:hypothetical protein [Actinokineospora auranticolor]PPK64440.1 hypothetical protein CLV40_1193 [Actinokineospora auranticolor]
MTRDDERQWGAVCAEVPTLDERARHFGRWRRFTELLARTRAGDAVSVWEWRELADELGQLHAEETRYVGRQPTGKPFPAADSRAVEPGTAARAPVPEQFACPVARCDRIAGAVSTPAPRCQLQDKAMRSVRLGGGPVPG